MSVKSQLERSHNLLWYVMAGIFLLLIAVAGGCQSLKPNLPNSIPDTATSVERASSHVESADALVKQARPDSGKTGQALLDAAREEHAKAEAALKEARADLDRVQSERDALVKAKLDGDAKVYTVTHGWGYRTQVFVTWAFRILMLLVGLHFLALALSLFLPPPYSVIASFVGKIVNPFAWFQGVIDHIHIKRCEPCPDLKV